MEVDFKSDAVWGPGEGATIRERDRLEEQEHREDERRVRGPIRNLWSGVVETFHRV